MTAPSLPQAAVEAAARAICDDKSEPCGPCRKDAEVALLAALPILRAQWAEEVAGAIEATYLGADFGRNYDGTESPQSALGNAHDEALDHAASIVRNYTGGTQ